MKNLVDFFKAIYEIANLKSLPQIPKPSFYIKLKFLISINKIGIEFQSIKFQMPI